MDDEACVKLPVDDICIVTIHQYYLNFNKKNVVTSTEIFKPMRFLAL